MNTFKIALFGHRDLSLHKTVEKGLATIFSEIMRTQDIVEVYIGRNGEFDIFAASVIKRIMKNLGTRNVTMTLVLPYKNKNIEYYENYYDDIIIPESVEKVYYKKAITERNKWMVENCDQIIFCIERESGGAYNAFKYAEKLGKSIINLAKKN